MNCALACVRPQGRLPLPPATPSARHLALLRAVDTYWRVAGLPPTYRALASTLDLAVPTIQLNVAALCRLGLITRMAGARRTIQVTASGKLWLAGFRPGFPMTFDTAALAVDREMAHGRVCGDCHRRGAELHAFHRVTAGGTEYAAVARCPHCHAEEEV